MLQISLIINADFAASNHVRIVPTEEFTNEYTAHVTPCDFVTTHVISVANPSHEFIHELKNTYKTQNASCLTDTVSHFNLFEYIAKFYISVHFGISKNGAKIILMISIFEITFSQPCSQNMHLILTFLWYLLLALSAPISL